MPRVSSSLGAFKGNKSARRALGEMLGGQSMCWSLWVHLSWISPGPGGPAVPLTPPPLIRSPLGAPVNHTYWKRRQCFIGVRRITENRVSVYTCISVIYCKSKSALFADKTWSMNGFFLWNLYKHIIIMSDSTNAWLEKRWCYIGVKRTFEGRISVYTCLSVIYCNIKSVLLAIQKHKFEMK